MEVFGNDNVKSMLAIKENELSEVSPEKGMTVQEIIEQVRPYLTSCFETEKLVQKIMALGIPREEAEKFVQFLIDKELIGKLSNS